MDIWQARPSLRRYQALVVVDRDGTLIEDHGSSVACGDVQLKHDTLAALCQLPSAICVSIATNQPGVARGLFSLSQLRKFHSELLILLESAGVSVTFVAVCPHIPAPDGTPMCVCRKPGPGMIEQLGHLAGVKAKNTVMVGDREVDLAAGANAGVKALLVGPELNEQLLRWLDRSETKLTSDGK